MTGGSRPPDLVRRNVLPLVRQAQEAFRVVIVNGPRQSGKSTLLHQLRAEVGGQIRDLDGEELSQAARSDPVAFVRTSDRYLFIDEIQRGGDALVRAIKQRVDDRSNTTTYVLAGSTNFLTVPVLAESLAGRAVIIEVWPFSQGEREGTSDRFLDVLTGRAEDLVHLRCAELERGDYFDRIVDGGFPEPLALPAGRLRNAWFRSYVQTITQRDIGEFSRARQLGELPRLLRILAAGTGTELVKAKLAELTGIDRNTLRGYLPLLETVFLTRELPAWSRNPLGKVTKHPKGFVSDTGLVAALHDVSAASLARPISPLRGQLVETFVHNELVKQRTWSASEVYLHHWRDRGGAEVDLVVEVADGRIFGIECKSSLSVTSDDFRWLRALRGKLGDQFGHGVVLYLGRTPLSFGPQLTALPLSALWA